MLRGVEHPATRASVGPKRWRGKKWGGLGLGLRDGAKKRMKGERGGESRLKGSA